MGVREWRMHFWDSLSAPFPAFDFGGMYDRIGDLHFILLVRPARGTGTTVRTVSVRLVLMGLCLSAAPLLSAKS